MEGHGGAGGGKPVAAGMAWMVRRSKQLEVLLWAGLIWSGWSLSISTFRKYILPVDIDGTMIHHDTRMTPWPRTKPPYLTLTKNHTYLFWHLGFFLGILYHHPVFPSRQSHDGTRSSQTHAAWWKKDACPKGYIQIYALYMHRYCPLKGSNKKWWWFSNKSNQIKCVFGLMFLLSELLSWFKLICDDRQIHLESGFNLVRGDWKAILGTRSRMHAPKMHLLLYKRCMAIYHPLTVETARSQARERERESALEWCFYQSTRI